ncbi:hypothetical protein LEMLEM_LOCUS1764, partial [Lemmus lemmus]
MISGCVISKVLFNSSYFHAMNGRLKNLNPNCVSTLRKPTSTQFLVLLSPNALPPRSNTIQLLTALQFTWKASTKGNYTHSCRHPKTLKQ